MEVVAPPTSYVERRGASMAYQAWGEGPPNVIAFVETGVHLDLMWTDPDWCEHLSRAGENGRVVMFQQMGLGLSDRVERVPTLEEQAEDVLAIMDAEGMDSAVLFGLWSTTLPLVVLAATAPERVAGLVLQVPYAQGPEHASNGDGIAGFTPAEAQRVRDRYREVLAHWGDGRTLELWDLPLATTRNRRTMAMLERSSSGPGHAQAVFTAAMSADVREVLPLVQAPTRVLHHPGHVAPEASARHVAALIPNATFHSLPPSEPHMTLGSSQGPLFEQLIRAATNGKAVVRTDRQLATILFTDIVGSTQQLIEHGDAAWSVTLQQHEHKIRELVDESGGRLVKMIGDGSLSVFTAPAAAVRCAERICETGDDLGIEVRAGLHTGECERRHGDINGLAVNIAARVAAAAKPSEVLVSQTVADLVVGSGLTFAPQGAYELRGVPEPWDLLALNGEDLTAVTFDPSPCRFKRSDKMRIGAARRAPQLMRRFHRWETQGRRRLTGAARPRRRDFVGG